MQTRPTRFKELAKDLKPMTDDKYKDKKMLSVKKPRGILTIGHTHTHTQKNEPATKGNTHRQHHMVETIQPYIN
jgi:hypothetical protein